MNMASFYMSVTLPACWDIDSQVECRQLMLPEGKQFDLHTCMRK